MRILYQIRRDVGNNILATFIPFPYTMRMSRLFSHLFNIIIITVLIFAHTILIIIIIILCYFYYGL